MTIGCIVLVYPAAFSQRLEVAGYTQKQMHVILDPAQDVAHGNFLRSVPGAYEWWYFDAVSDDGKWSMVCIWFLGNPFSPYYRIAAQKQTVNPYDHNAVFFALSRHDTLYAYHYTRFPAQRIFADEQRPACLQFGPNQLNLDTDGHYQIALQDENANRRKLNADLTFAPTITVQTPTEIQSELTERDKAHWWLPAAPECRVTGQIALREAQNHGPEMIAFQGRGYHDHNWGTLPFDDRIRDWYWARASLGPGLAIILYHVIERDHQCKTHVLIFENGCVVRQEQEVHVQLSRWRWNAFGTCYATQIDVTASDMTARFQFRGRLDSAPFYLRLKCDVIVKQNGTVRTGQGIGEYFRPNIMSSPIVASAMKARIVEA